jgi:hypothetical protein
LKKFIPTSETQIAHTISKAHDKLALLEFNPRHAALITQFRLLHTYVSEGDMKARPLQ